jgi:hypothetical protein
MGTILFALEAVMMFFSGAMVVMSYMAIADMMYF